MFCFDLAMVVRGLASAARLELITPDPALIDRYGRAASAPDRSRRIVRRLRGSSSEYGAAGSLVDTPGRLPRKGRGGHRHRERVLPGIDPAVRASAEATYAASLAWTVESPHDDVHALLYAFEGILSLPGHPQFQSVLPRVAAQFSALLAEALALGFVPESRQRAAAPEAPHRLDVLAQTVRVGHLLSRHLPQQPPDRIGLARLQQMLVQHVRPDGALPFSMQSDRAQSNVWAAMFAEQALGFVPHSGDGRSPRSSGRCSRDGGLRTVRQRLLGASISMGVDPWLSGVAAGSSGFGSHPSLSGADCR